MKETSEWITKWFGLLGAIRFQIDPFDINFLAGSWEGNRVPIDVEALPESPRSSLHTLVRKDNGRPWCRARTGFEERG